jgi:hypothetical protein
VNCNTEISLQQVEKSRRVSTRYQFCFIPSSYIFLLPATRNYVPVPLLSSLWSVLTFKHWTEYIFSFQMAQFGIENSHICKYGETVCFHGNEVRKKRHTRPIRNILLFYVQIKPLSSLFSHKFSWDYCSRKNWNKISEGKSEFRCSYYAYVYLVHVRLGAGGSNWTTCSW